jgi:hypothetical protein
MLASVTAFETSAVLDDDLHLTLREPVPHASSRECRVIVMFENGASSSVWPPGFFDEIRITDPAFTRLSQGDAPPVPALDA